MLSSEILNKNDAKQEFSYKIRTGGWGKTPNCCCWKYLLIVTVHQYVSYKVFISKIGFGYIKS